MKTKLLSSYSLSWVAAGGLVALECVSLILGPAEANAQTVAGPVTPDVPVVVPAPVPGGVTVVAPPGAAVVPNTQIVSANGIVDVYEPGTRFVVRETTGPVTYTYGPQVVYVGPAGVILTPDEVARRMHAGLPVKVEYVNEGPVRVVRRVVIEER
ncbi:hypothetical protein [Prosthecobacter sp.]|uniref:hypothetical protein n=1 Tax=Prosthecobacter sp. TaxID=1965333 RepID=UPI003783E339